MEYETEKKSDYKVNPDKTQNRNFGRKIVHGLAGVVAGVGIILATTGSNGGGCQTVMVPVSVQNPDGYWSPPIYLPIPLPR